MLEAFKKLFVPGYLRDEPQYGLKRLIYAVRMFFSYLAILTLPIGTIVAFVEHSPKEGIVVMAELLAGIMCCMLFIAWCYGVTNGDN